MDGWTDGRTDGRNDLFWQSNICRIAAIRNTLVAIMRTRTLRLAATGERGDPLPDTVTGQYNESWPFGCSLCPSNASAATSCSRRCSHNSNNASDVLTFMVIPSGKSSPYGHHLMTNIKRAGQAGPVICEREGTVLWAGSPKNSAVSVNLLRQKFAAPRRGDRLGSASLARGDAKMAKLNS